jgi:hypothetical protein
MFVVVLLKNTLQSGLANIIGDMVADAPRDSAEAASSLTRRRKLWRRSVVVLFPFNRCRRLAGDIVHNPINPPHLVYNPG